MPCKLRSYTVYIKNEQSRRSEKDSMVCELQKEGGNKLNLPIRTPADKRNTISKKCIQ